MPYVMHVLVLVGIYVILAVSLDILVGHTGLFSIAHGALFAVGAYASALLSTVLGSPYLVALGAALLLGALSSLLLYLPALRLSGERFLLATLALQMLVIKGVMNWNDLTGGPLGVRNIPHPAILGWSVDSEAEFALLVGVAAVLSWLLARRVVQSPFGRVLRGIRDDETFTMSLGKDTRWFKIGALGISAVGAALAGSLYAHYMTYIDPTSFTVMESILVLSMVIVGGAGSAWGPPLGAIVLVFLPEILRFAGFPSSVAANLRQIAYGGMLIAVVWLRPSGLVGRHSVGRWRG